MQANRNGLFYVLDRATGKVLLARPFVQTTWATGVGADGRPIVPNNLGTSEACVPDHRGATNFPPPSYDPARGLFFVTARETCAVYTPGPPSPPPPDRVTMTMGRGPLRVDDRDSYLVLRAIDAASGEKRWEIAYKPLPSTQMLAFGGGVLSTAAGLVFASDDEGNFRAVNASDGRILWQAALGASPAGAAADDLHARRPAVDSDLGRIDNPGVRAPSAVTSTRQCISVSKAAASGVDTVAPPSYSQPYKLHTVPVLFTNGSSRVVTRRMDI